MIKRLIFFFGAIITTFSSSCDVKKPVQKGEEETRKAIKTHESKSVDKEDTIPEKKQINTFLKLLWKVETKEDNDNPLLSNDVIFLSDGKIIDAFTGEILKISDLRRKKITDSLLVYSDRSGFKIINLKNGKAILKNEWHRNFFFENGSPELLKDSIYLAMVGENIFKAINVFNNKTIWEYHSLSKVFNRPVVTGESIFISNKSEIFELNKFSGKTLNRIDIPDYNKSSLTIDDDLTYVFIKDKGLRVIDMADGNKVLWQKSFPFEANYIYDIESDSNFVYFSNFNLYAINKFTGEEKWRLDKPNNNIEIDRNDILAQVKNYLIFNNYIGGESLLTVADKYSGKILFEGRNSDIIPSDKETFNEPPAEDLQFLQFANELVDNRILVGKMGKKVYGFEILR